MTTTVRTSALLTRGLTAAWLILAALGWSAPGTAQTCVGDCDGDGQVFVHELLIGVNILLGEQPVTNCLALADDAGMVTVSQLMQGVNNALGSCPAGPTATPTPTIESATPTASPSLTTMPPTPNATPTPSGAPTATETATVAAGVCGDGVLDPGETCDDGNTADGDACPANCRIEVCAGPPQGTVTVQLRFATMPADLTLDSLRLFLRYPEGRVSIPGSGTDAAVQARIASPAGFDASADDLDYGVRGILAAPTQQGIGAGTALTVQFDICAGVAVPIAGDFECTVEDATAGGEPVTGQVTCSIAVQPPVLPLVCGDGIVNLAGGETCDDGNTEDGDSCPSNCRIEPCAGPSQGSLTVRAQVSGMPADLTVAGMTLQLDYPDGRVALPGSGNDAAVQARVTSPVGFSVTPNDLDYALRAVLLDPQLMGIGNGTALSVDFDICAGAAVPQPGNFDCSVVDASAFDDQGILIDVSDQVTCSVAVDPPVLPLVCGDGVVNLAGGETCDDGNTEDGDSCPSTCHIEPCGLPGSQTVTASVQFSAMPADLAVSGMTLLIDYPEGDVGIQGAGNDAAVQSHVSSGSFSITPNDLDYALRAVLIDPTFTGVTAGPALSIQFDVCQGAALPPAAAFSCTVLDAADADLAPVTDQITCSLVLP